jgi:CSLREA domain-containing protein
MKTRHLLISFTLGLGLALTLLWILGGIQATYAGNLLSGAKAPAAIITVDTTADELDGGAGNGHCSLREAINNANNDNGAQADCVAGNGADTVNLPTGTYTLTIGGEGEDAAAEGDLDIIDDLTIIGTEAISTVIDGRGIDRVFHIDTTASVTMHNVTIQHGFLDDECPMTGGGILNQGTLWLEDCTVYDNHTEGSGGGITNHDGTLTLVDCTVADNSSSGAGGGIKNGHESGGTATLTNTIVSGNSNGYQGGGIHTGCDAELTLNACTIVGNASGRGGGLSIYGNATLNNSFVTDNEIGMGGSGCGLYVSDANPQLHHNTIARNYGGGGQGLYVEDGGAPQLYNTILASHTVGIHVTDGSTITLEATLWGTGAWANTTNWDGLGSMSTGTVNIYSNPAFVNPTARNYHLSGASAAIGAGIDVGIATDMDGEARDVNPDIGADEVVSVKATIPPTGGQLSAPDGTVITFPSGAVSGSIALIYSPQPITATGTFTGPGLFFDLTAIYTGTGQPATIQPGYRYTITVEYDETRLPSGAKEANLALYYLDNSRWVKEPTSVVNVAANTITATPNHFSLWAALVEEYKIYLPLVLRSYVAP